MPVATIIGQLFGVGFANQRPINRKVGEVEVLHIVARPVRTILPQYPAVGSSRREKL
jgi:hypothetical protein